MGRVGGAATTARASSVSGSLRSLKDSAWRVAEEKSQRGTQLLTTVRSKAQGSSQRGSNFLGLAKATALSAAAAAAAAAESAKAAVAGGTPSRGGRSSGSRALDFLNAVDDKEVEKICALGYTSIAARFALCQGLEGGVDGAIAWLQDEANSDEILAAEAAEIWAATLQEEKGSRERDPDRSSPEDFLDEECVFDMKCLAANAASAPVASSPPAAASALPAAATAAPEPAVDVDVDDGRGLGMGRLRTAAAGSSAAKRQGGYRRRWSGGSSADRACREAEARAASGPVAIPAPLPPAASRTSGAEAMDFQAPVAPAAFIPPPRRALAEAEAERQAQAETKAEAKAEAMAEAMAETSAEAEEEVAVEEDAEVVAITTAGAVAVAMAEPIAPQAEAEEDAASDEDGDRSSCSSGSCCESGSSVASALERLQMLEDEEAQASGEPPDGGSWEWPLSRHEKKARLAMADKRMQYLDRQVLIRALIKERVALRASRQ